MFIVINKMTKYQATDTQKVLSYKKNKQFGELKTEAIYFSKYNN